jgi:repressor LexA
MNVSDRDSRFRDRIQAVSVFLQDKGRMPSFSELGNLIGVHSKSTVSKFVRRLEKQGAIQRDERGRLIPLHLKGTARLLGTVEAGFPSPAEEELADTLSLDDLLIQNPQATFLLKVSGDSMIDAGIRPGDTVIVDKGATPKSGDIVIAEVDGQWTMKFLKKRGDKVALLPANPNYKPIIPKTELKIAGVVTSMFRQYR